MGLLVLIRVLLLELLPWVVPLFFARSIQDLRRVLKLSVNSRRVLMLLTRPLVGVLQTEGLLTVKRETRFLIMIKCSDASSVTESCFSLGATGGLMCVRTEGREYIS